MTPFWQSVTQKGYVDAYFETAESTSSSLDNETELYVVNLPLSGQFIEEEKLKQLRGDSFRNTKLHYSLAADDKMALNLNSVISSLKAEDRIVHLADDLIMDQMEMNEG